MGTDFGGPLLCQMVCRMKTWAVSTLGETCVINLCVTEKTILNSLSQSPSFTVKEKTTYIHLDPSSPGPRGSLVEP